MSRHASSSLVIVGLLASVAIGMGAVYWVSRAPSGTTISETDNPGLKKEDGNDWWKSSAKQQVMPTHDDKTAQTKEVPVLKETEEKDESILDKAEREYLWEVEHYVNLLAEDAFKPLSKAIISADADKLRAAIAEDFVGEIAQDNSPAELHRGGVDVVRQRGKGETTVKLNREEFVNTILAFRKLVPEGVTPKARLAVMNLHPVNRKELDNLWEGSAQLRIAAVDKDSRPLEVMIYLSYKILQPNEEAIKAGGWMKQCTIVQNQVAKADKKLFKEVAKERGLTPEDYYDNWQHTSSRELVPTTGGVFVCDFDRDGCLDILVTDIKFIRFFKNTGDGKFVDATTEIGLRPYQSRPFSKSLVSFVDLDNDGWEDLILGDVIFKNQQGRRLVDMTAQCNLRFSQEFVSIAIADYDRDGRVDIYTTTAGKGKSSDWLSEHGGQRIHNSLWKNLGDWQFKDVTDETGTAINYPSAFTAIWLDSNNDNWPDLHVINEFGPGTLYLNRQDGTFKAIPLITGPSDFGTMGVTCGDFNNDGNIDIYAQNMYSKAGNRVIGNLRPDAYPQETMDQMKTFVLGSQLWRNEGGEKFSPVGMEMQVRDVGWAYGASMADFDGDGFLDIYGTAGFISKDRDKPDG